jgi:putative membrane protein
MTVFASGLAVTASQALSNVSGRGYGHEMMWGGWGWGGMIIGPLMMILFIAAVVVLVVLAVRWLGGWGHGTVAPGHMPPARTPLDTLKERFAKGEIDKEEFAEKKRLLSD